MSLKRQILTATAALTIGLSGGLLAQTAAMQVQKDVATDTGTPQPSAAAERNKDMLVNEATAADAKYHESRTEPNRQARDQAEAAAAAAAGMPQPQYPAGAR
ncbi:MAG TPA: hypothetical protein VES73_09000 [Lamprocystis sp. (in: g-proteobacteria)]|nr:hypothetical protein [Lamprocystis sp. (in: g-proteobacteria)]